MRYKRRSMRHPCRTDRTVLRSNHFTMGIEGNCLQLASLRGTITEVLWASTVMVAQESKLMADRLGNTRTGFLSFEVPNRWKVDQLEFQTSEDVLGMEVGYSVEQEHLQDSEFSGSVESFVDTFCPFEDVSRVVKQTQDWISRLDLIEAAICLELKATYRFPWGNTGFIGRGLAGLGRRALLTLEFIPKSEGELTIDVPYPGANGTDVIPHELVHIKDVFEGRSPSMHPLQEEAWVDLLRHLWIDGYLERIGGPHGSREMRARELVDGLGRVASVEKEVIVDQVVDEWWGKPMTLREAVTAGLALGFTLERNGPMETWFQRTR